MKPGNLGERGMAAAAGRPWAVAVPGLLKVGESMLFLRALWRGKTKVRIEKTKVLTVFSKVRIVFSKVLTVFGGGWRRAVSVAGRRRGGPAVRCQPERCLR